MPNSQQNPDGSWTPSVPGGPLGTVAKIEFWLRARGWKRTANVLGRWDERGLRGQLIAFRTTHNPPEKGDVVMVGDERCRVLACPVTWEGREWTMKRGVKVRPEPLSAGQTDKENQDDR